MGKTKQYWQDQRDLKMMYDFDMQADLMKRVQDAIANKQAKKAEESCRQRSSGKPFVSEKN